MHQNSFAQKLLVFQFRPAQVVFIIWNPSTPRKAHLWCQPSPYASSSSPPLSDSHFEVLPSEATTFSSRESLTRMPKSRRIARKKRKRRKNWPWVSKFDCPLLMVDNRNCCWRLVSTVKWHPRPYRTQMSPPFLYPSSLPPTVWSTFGWTALSLLLLKKTGLRGDVLEDQRSLQECRQHRQTCLLGQQSPAVETKAMEGKKRVYRVHSRWRAPLELVQHHRPTVCSPARTSQRATLSWRAVSWSSSPLDQLRARGGTRRARCVATE